MSGAPRRTLIYPSRVPDVPTRAPTPQRAATRAARSRVIFVFLGLVVTGVVIAGDRRRRLGHQRGQQRAVARHAASRSSSGATSRVYAADGTRLGFIQSDDAAHAGRRPTEIPDVDARGDGRDRGPALLRARAASTSRASSAPRSRTSSPSKTVQGGSTLTHAARPQPLHGRARAHGVAGYKRKIREAKLAEELEDRHPGRPGKLWILDKYLNSVPYGTVGGQTAVGVQAAARIFFDKPATRADAARGGAAGRPAAGAVELQPVPRPERRASRAATRCCSEMADQGYITQATAARDEGDGPLGVKQQPLLHEQPRGLLLRLRQAGADRPLRRSTPCARAGCGSTRRSTCKLQKAARKAIDGHLGAPATALARSSRSTRSTGYIRAMASSSQLRRLEVQPRRPGPPPAGLDVQGHGADDRAARAASTPTRTTLRVAGRSTSTTADYGADCEGPDLRHTYGGSMNLVTRDAAVRQHRLRAARPRPRPRAVRQDRHDMGITTPARRLPGRGPRRPDARRLAARDGRRLRDDRLRRLPQQADRDHARSTFPDGHVDDLGKPERAHASSTTASTYEATKILEKNVQARHRHRGADRLPGGRQDRHDRQLHRRLVRRLHAAACRPRSGSATRTTRRCRSARTRAGGAIAAPIWGDVHEVGQGQVLRRLPAAEGAVRGRSRSSASTRSTGAHGRQRRQPRQPAADAAGADEQAAAPAAARRPGHRQGRRRHVPADAVRVPAAAGAAHAAAAPAPTAGAAAAAAAAGAGGGDGAAPAPIGRRAAATVPRRMAKEEKVEFEGEVIEALPNAMFRVKLDNDHIVLGHVAGKMRRFRIRILPGRPRPRRAVAVRPRPRAHRLPPPVGRAARGRARRSSPRSSELLRPRSRARRALGRRRRRRRARARRSR